MQTFSEILFYAAPFLVSFVLIQPFVWFIRKIATRNQVLDVANVPRKLQRTPVPLWGGVAIGLALLVSVGLFSFFGFLTDIKVSNSYLIGLVAAIIFLLIGGALDDKYDLRPWQQIVWPVLAVLTILIAGIKVNYVTNPFGGIYYFDQVESRFGSFVWFPLAQTVAFAWLLVMIYTTKFLDGLDGLVSGITTIGAVIIFIVSLRWDVPNSATSVLALITAGLFGGFLIWNFFPAKIFLGESGSTIAGLMLGVLAIISGGKIATTLLVMGLPLLDVVWVIGRRLFWERTSPTRADRKHLHFRLLDMGLTHRQAVLFLYLSTALFGSLGLFQNTLGKLKLLVVLAVIMVVLAIWLVTQYKRTQRHES